MAYKNAIPFKPDQGIKEALDDLSRKEDRSISWLVNLLVREGLEKRGYKIPPKKTGK